MGKDEIARIAATTDATYGSEVAERLEEIWKGESGLKGFLSTVDHKKIGKRYLVTAFGFLVLGGIEALIMRLQLAQSNEHLLTPDRYNQLFTMHGITMIFLYAFPILSGFSNFLWPLLFGSRDMAFPRLNAFSYWVFLFSGLFIYSAFLLGHTPDAGWFNYTPYTERAFDPGRGIDVYALGMVFFGISTTAGSINFIVTFLRNKAPGLSVNRVPIVIWGTLTASVGNVFAVPAVSLAFFLLWTDRALGTKFFLPAGGGNPLLWQHLFWIFGHPWVYSIVLPAMGFVSDGLPTFCRRPLVGYTIVALSTILTMFIGFGVWVHHMFATGLPPLALSFFGAASLFIVVPSGIAVFSWMATIFTGRPRFTTTFYFFAGFVVLFTIGGVSGFMTAAVPLDWQLTDSYFVVAHIHYVLIGINVFPVVGALYMWFPKFTGKMLSERLGKWNFWVMFIGFNIGFFPMHILGILGMPRRIYTYQPYLGWDSWNLVTSIGAFLFALGVLLFFINVALSLRSGEKAPANPWDSYSLEWSTPSPPPSFNFVSIPIIASRHPLWEERLGEGPERSRLRGGLLLDHGRETIGTTALDAEPDVILKMPGDTTIPFWCTVALTLMFAGMVMQNWWTMGIAILLTIGITIAWLLPRDKLVQTERGAHA